MTYYDEILVFLGVLDVDRITMKIQLHKSRKTITLNALNFVQTSDIVRVNVSVSSANALSVALTTDWKSAEQQFYRFPSLKFVITYFDFRPEVFDSTRCVGL